MHKFPCNKSLQVERGCNGGLKAKQKVGLLYVKDQDLYLLQAEVKGVISQAR